MTRTGGRPALSVTPISADAKSRRKRSPHMISSGSTSDDPALSPIMITARSAGGRERTMTRMTRTAGSVPAVECPSPARAADGYDTLVSQLSVVVPTRDEAGNVTMGGLV
jgi:hypothetical protein